MLFGKHRLLDGCDKGKSKTEFLTLADTESRVTFNNNFQPWERMAEGMWSRIRTGACPALRKHQWPINTKQIGNACLPLLGCGPFNQVS